MPFGSRAPIVFAVIVSVVFGALTAEARRTPRPRPTPAEQCLAAKLRATATSTDNRSRCYSLAKQRNKPVDQTCLDKAAAQLAGAIAELDSQPPCDPFDDVAKYMSQVEGFVGNVTAANLCAAKIAASGHLAKALLLCEASRAKKGPTSKGPCKQRAQEKFEAAFSRADTKGCMPTGGAAAIQNYADAMVNATSSVRIYATAQQPNGAVGNRITTNAICSGAAVAQGLLCPHTVSLLSYTSDQVSDFPTSKGLPQSAPLIAGTQRIADNWADFLDGTWSSCLGDACTPAGPVAGDIFPNSTAVFSGSNNNGTTASANCNNWTDALSSTTAIYGECYGTAGGDPFAPCEAGQTFAAPSGTVSCGAPLIFLCVCY